MKKVFIYLLLAIVPAKAFNQISQGSLITGGEFSYQVTSNKSEQGNNTTEGPTRTRFSLIPNIEYFLADNLSAGMGIGYEMTKSQTETPNSQTTTKNGTFLISPYVKKYFNLGDNAYFYGQAILNFGLGKETNEFKAGTITTTNEDDNSSIGIGIVPGFRYDISEKIGLEAGIGFIGFTQYMDKSGAGANERRDISKTFQFSIVPNTLTLGIRYRLN
jgi:hypothetical protein